MVKTQMFIAAALMVGVAIGYFVKPEDAGAASGVQQETAAKVPLEDKGAEASIAALRARIADLERQLAERSEANEEERKVDTEESQQRAERSRDGWRRPPSGAEMRERMARLEKENPQRFAQMTNHFAQMRARRRERAAMKMDFLSSVDTSGMSESAKRTHADLQRLIERRDEIEERMHDANLSDEERGELFREMRENDRAMRDLNRMERDNLLAQTSAALGLSDEDAVELTETVRDIIEATEGHFGGGGPPPGPRP
ncbi:MAG: hypothetical protein II863_01800 [Kiritimatiellae bacterium]|nr:hypothetical protein [Kiritimatiellia bacterium]